MYERVKKAIKKNKLYKSYTLTLVISKIILTHNIVEPANNNDLL